jgi:hypothetical protein
MAGWRRATQSIAKQGGSQLKRKLIEVVIEGITPLLMNRFHEEAQQKTEGGTSMAVNGDRGTPREQAAPKVYADAKGRPMIPGPNIFSCIVETGKYHKVGKKQVTTGRSSLIPAGISVMEIEAPLSHPKGETPAWEVDSRPIVNPATKGRRLSHRPRFDEWRVGFTLDVDAGMFDPKFVRQLVDDAGTRVGLGDFRPDRKGPFGKFKVVKWEMVDA